MSSVGFPTRYRAEWGLDASEPVCALPFVYVFGRADFTVSYYGANLYPENVTVGLEKTEFVDSLTGKFVLDVPASGAGDTVLSLIVELAPGVAVGRVDTAAIAASVRRELRRLNSEFANYVPADQQTPSLALRTYEDSEYFPSGVKHRYTRR